MGAGVVIVTGSSGGIGSAIVARLADACTVVATDLEATGTPWREKSDGTVIPVPADLTIAEDRAEVVRAAQSAGPVVGLVNCAGVVPTGDPLQISHELWRHVMEINVEVPYLICSALAPLMIEGGGGAIVNIGSIAAVRPSPLNLVYAASKSALTSMTMSLAAALAPRGVRVNSVCPGLIDTRLTIDTDARLATVRGVPVEQVRRDRTDAVPMRRLGSVNEVADVVAFLLSDQAGYVTGQSFHVNGGAFMTS